MRHLRHEARARFVFVFAITSILFFPLISHSICGGFCGDGFVDSGEECDDGNLLLGDGCSADCTESFNMVVGTALFTYPGEATRDIAAADLNNDGIEDLLVANYRSAYLYTYLINPDGSITQAGRYPLGSNTIMLDVGSLNGDHFVDAVTADADTDKMYVFFGNGDGTLTLARVYDPGDRPRSVRVGDINTDGFDDMTAGCMFSAGFRIYYGDGAGGFPTNEFINTGGSAITSDISDLNGDGYNDLVLSTLASSGRLQVYHGSGLGLTLSQTFPIATTNAIATDLNKDGYPDILGIGALTNSEQYKATTLRAYTNQGDASFIQTQELYTGRRGWMLDKGDLNNDGIEDIALATRDNGGVRIYLGDGQGWVQDVIVYSNYSSDGMAIVDVNLDGAPDVLAAVYASGTVIPVHNHSYYQFPVCGDSRIGRGENCDDGNTEDGDGCSSTCQVEQAGDGDKDGLTDVEEDIITTTDPLNPDTDGDCALDGEEYCAGADPLDPSDQDGCVELAAPLTGNWHMLVTLIKAPAQIPCDVELVSPISEPLIKNSLKNVGKVAQAPVEDGDTIIFNLHVDATSIGPGEYDVSSDSFFARVYMTDAYHYKVGFEVMPVGLADWDFKDLVIQVEFLPTTPAVGIHTNSLREFEAHKFASPGAETNVSLDFDGFAVVSVPPGALMSDSGIILTAGLPELYQNLEGDGLELLGGHRKLTLTNGQQALSGEATISIAYQQGDWDAFADGTSLMETDLAILCYDQNTGFWLTLASTVDPVQNIVTATTDYVSLFALGVPPLEDGDGLPTWWENAYSCMMASTVDNLADYDGDALNSETEYGLGSNPCDPDSDADGIDDGDEVNTFGTDPAAADTDADGVPDWDEIYYYGSNPIDPDTDADGLSDGDEADIYGTDLCDPDGDSDGLNDGDEVLSYGTDPDNPDSDSDGINDGEEYDTYGTDPLSWDSDDDGLPDAYEIEHAGDAAPLDPLSAVDGLIGDFDGDGNPNAHEFYNGSDPWSPDPTGAPGCLFWADSGAGEGILGPVDLTNLEMELSAEGAGDYSGVIPDNAETQDLTGEGIMGPGDLTLMERILKNEVMGPELGSRPTGITAVDVPSGSVASGSTCHVSVVVNNEAGNLSPGFGVVFEIDPSSTAGAMLLGGDGDSVSGGRYDVTGPRSEGAGATMVLKVSGSGSVIINVSTPQCGGGDGAPGRSCAALNLSPAAVIIVE